MCHGKFHSRKKEKIRGSCGTWCLKKKQKKLIGSCMIKRGIDKAAPWRETTCVCYAL